MIKWGGGGGGGGGRGRGRGRGGSGLIVSANKVSSAALL